MVKRSPWLTDEASPDFTDASDELSPSTFVTSS